MARSAADTRTIAAQPIATRGLALVREAVAWVHDSDPDFAAEQRRWVADREGDLR